MQLKKIVTAAAYFRIHKRISTEVCSFWDSYPPLSPLKQELLFAFLSSLFSRLMLLQSCSLLEETDNPYYQQNSVHQPLSHQNIDIFFFKKRKKKRKKNCQYFSRFTQWKCWLLFRKRRKSDIVRIILVYTFFSHTRSSFLIFSGLKNFQPVSAIMLKPFSSIALPLPSLFASCSTVIMQCWGRRDSTHCQQTLLPCRHSLRPFSPCLNFVAC